MLRNKLGKIPQLSISDLLTPRHKNKELRTSADTDTLILNIYTRWMNVHSTFQSLKKGADVCSHGIYTIKIVFYNRLHLPMAIYRLNKR
jgi:hypothetical protein